MIGTEIWRAFLLESLFVKVKHSLDKNKNTKSILYMHTSTCKAVNHPLLPMPNTHRQQLSSSQGKMAIHSLCSPRAWLGNTWLVSTTPSLKLQICWIPHHAIHAITKNQRISFHHPRHWTRKPLSKNPWELWNRLVSKPSRCIDHIACARLLLCHHLQDFLTRIQIFCFNVP